MPLQKSHPIRDFRSGEDELDTFLHRYALKNEGPGSRTFVLLRDETLPAEPIILGFYSLSLASISPTVIAEHHEKRLPPYPQLGAVLLARLGRDVRARGTGIGRALLFDALRRCELLGRHAGCAGVLVDPKHADAAASYGAVGFAPLSSGTEGPARMYLPLALLSTLNTR